MSLELQSIHIENLRGYTAAEFAIDRPRIVLVGENNSGKTSLLKILGWFLTGVPLSVLEQREPVRDEDLDLLLPARTTRNRARRLTVDILVHDGRRHSRFLCEDGIASLRISLKLTPEPLLITKLGAPSRGESDDPDLNALDLLAELREAVLFLHVPSVRDADSIRFNNTLREAFRARLSERALHSRQAGAPSEYRKVKAATNQLRRVANDLASPLWDSMKQELPAGMAASAKIELECSPEDVVTWMADQMRLRLATGAHDQDAVRPVELGSGLQSLLDLAVQRGEHIANAPQLILAVEEPEAFLHPSAQRTVARRLIDEDSATNLLLTTHSPLLVEEATYGDIVLVRDHEFFFPIDRPGSVRDEINSAFMNGLGAELMFSRAALLVEGEGDRLFFDALRRRIARVDDSGATDALLVLSTGSNTQFAPWITLLESYGTPSRRPIQWIVVADGDASTEVRDGLRNAGVVVPNQVSHALGNVKAMSTTLQQWPAAVRDANTEAAKAKLPLRLLPVDLESASLAQASPQTIDAIATKAGWTDIQSNRELLLKRLGSKGVPQPSPGKKAPWLRGFIGGTLPWTEMSADVVAILKLWLETTMSAAAARRLLAAAQ